jgi:hypothetical protein
LLSARPGRRRRRTAQRIISKLFGLRALVGVDSIEPPAVQVQGLLNFVDSVGQAALLSVEGV